MPVIDTSHEVAPKIVETMQDFITREGQSARFQCKIAGTSRLNACALHYWALYLPSSKILSYHTQVKKLQ